MSIGSIGSNNSVMQYVQGGRSSQRPDPASMAQDLFAKLDTSGQGYLDKSELQAGLDQVSLSSKASSMSVNNLMAKLDANGDGKVTESEFTDALKGAAQQVGGHHHGHHGHHASAAASQETDGASSASATSAATTAAGGCEAGSSSGSDDSSKVLQQVMRLMQAYNAGGSNASANPSLSPLAVTA